MEHDAKVKADELKKAKMSSKIIGILGSAQAGSSRCVDTFAPTIAVPLQQSSRGDRNVDPLGSPSSGAHQERDGVDWFRRIARIWSVKLATRIKVYFCSHKHQYMFAKEACRKSFTVEMNTDWRQTGLHLLRRRREPAATPRGRRAAREAEERKKVEEEANAKGTNEVLKGGGGGPSVTPIGLPISTARTQPNQQARRAEEKKEVTPATQNRAKVPAIFGDSSAQCEDPSERKPYGKARAGPPFQAEARGQEGQLRKVAGMSPSHSWPQRPPCSRCVKADVPCEK
ncbi:hypothetical protein IMY05_C4819000200 [Salix suchowensis]|nr:hypothetical protein IMY05_C4819000200 [Salix suchowensis]